jgi:hypothetical protein
VGIRRLVARLRSALEGNGFIISVAIFFVALGLILIPFVLLSSVQFTGTAVHGVDRGGIVYYSYKGQNYSLDDTSKFNSHTVYFRPSRPDTTAELGNTPMKVLDVVIVAIPFLIAFTIAGVEARRYWRYRRARNKPEPVGFGQGLDHDVLRRLNEKRRREEQS